jgi:hypothetical protein
MDTRQAYYRAYHEIRANGSDGYQVLRNALARAAACQAFRNRLESDEIALARRRYTDMEFDLFWHSEPDT